jgi:uncharacterized protein YjiS (DUF1127 family)
MARNAMRNSLSAFAPDVSKAVITNVSRAAQPAQKIFISFLRYLHAWRRYNATLRELSSLTDPELADLGITRTDIPRVVSGSCIRPEDGAFHD